MTERITRAMVIGAILLSTMGLTATVAATSPSGSATAVVSSRTVASTPGIGITPRWVERHGNARVSAGGLYPDRLTTLQARRAPDGVWHDVATRKATGYGSTHFYVTAPWTRDTTIWYRVRAAGFRDSAGSHPALLTSAAFLKNNATRMSGTVTVPVGTPGGGAGIDLAFYKKTSAGWRIEYQWGIDGKMYAPVTGSGGAYIAHNVPPGTYKVQFWQNWGGALATTWLGGTSLSTNSTPIQASGEPKSNVNVAMLIGNESISVDTSPLASQPYDRAFCAWLEGEPLQSYSCTSVSETGPASVVSLIPGKYKVYAYLWGTQRWVRTWYPSSPTRAGATAVEVVEGGPAPQVTIKMVPR